MASLPGESKPLLSSSTDSSSGTMSAQDYGTSTVGRHGRTNSLTSIRSVNQSNGQVSPGRLENDHGQDQHPNYDAEAPFPPESYRGTVKTLAREKGTGRLVYIPQGERSAHFVEETTVPSSPTLNKVYAKIPALDSSLVATMSRPEKPLEKTEIPTDPNFVTISTKADGVIGPSCGSHDHKALPQPIPPKFGVPEGVEIDNKDCIMAHVDHAIGTDKPPAVEYIFCEPYLTKVGSWNKNPFGHACVRYTLPSGQQYLVNIEMTKSSVKMVTVYDDPAEFFFGLQGMDQERNTQQGMYQRHMVGVRIEDWKTEDILIMHRYFQELVRLRDSGNATFSLFFGSSFWNKWPWFGNSETDPVSASGNCAQWTSRALQRGHLVDRPTMWPKRILTKLLERPELRYYPHEDALTVDKHSSRYEAYEANRNVHVVMYRRIPHAEHTYTSDYTNDHLCSCVAPYSPRKSRWYAKMEKFADVIVEVPEGTLTAVVEKHTPTKKPWVKRKRSWLFGLRI